MKETIYTIPINDALDKECFCPLCEMKKDLEESEVRYAVGPAMMEPDFRELTNKKGFCKKHMADLNAESKALALALVFDTHLAELEKIMESDLSAKKGIFGKGENGFEKLAGSLKEVKDSCVICERIESTFARYIDNFVYLLKKDGEFLNKVLKSEGFCMEHFSMLLSVAAKEMSAKEFEKCFVPVIEHQKKRLKKYHGYIKNFVDSFDYRNKGKDMDAPKDTLVKTGFLTVGEFEPRDKNLKNI